MKRTTTLLGLALAASAFGLNAGAADINPKLYGNEASASGANRVVEITPATKYVNVIDGDTVKFKIEGREFTWTFDLYHQEGVVELSSILPKDMRAGDVKVYVASDPSYR